MYPEQLTDEERAERQRAYEQRRAEEQRAELTERARLIELAARVAAQLGDDWTADWFRNIDDEPYYHLIRLTGPALALSLVMPNYQHPAMFEVMPHTEPGTERPYRTKCPSIRVSTTRTAEAIARDISRRLMPDALAYVAEVNELTNAETNRRAAMQRNAETIAAAYGHDARVIAADRDGGRPRVYLGSFGRIEVSADGADLDLHLSPERAALVVELLAREANR